MFAFILWISAVILVVYGIIQIFRGEALMGIVFIVVGIILLAFFVRRQFKLPVPLLRIEVLKTRNFRIDAILVASYQVILIGGTVIFPIYIQNILGYSPMETGFIMLPGALGGAIGGLIAGNLFDRFGDLMTERKAS